jgi:hypothetical protein
MGLGGRGGHNGGACRGRVDGRLSWLAWDVRNSNGNNHASDVSVSDGLAVVALTRRIVDPAVVRIDVLSHRCRSRTRWHRSRRSRLAGNRRSWVRRSGVVGGHRVARGSGIDVGRQPGSVVGGTMLSSHGRGGRLEFGDGNGLGRGVGSWLDVSGSCGTVVMMPCGSRSLRGGRAA